MSGKIEKVKIVNDIPYVLCEDDMNYYPLVTKDKNNGLTYTLDTKTFVYYPNLTVTNDDRYIGIWGQRRKSYLKEQKPILYMQMFDDNSLVDHLIEINEAAENMAEQLETQMVQAEGVTEELKANDQMEWVRRMNSIISRVNEIVLHDLIYV
ncbi:MAG: TnpV protein [Clostridia bacterium]|nr:TnpV protein [Clostridia bacterium]